MRGTVKKLKQFLAEFQRHERAERSSGHVTEQGIGSKGNRDQAEGKRGTHLGDRWTGQLEGGETVKVAGREKVR